MPMDFDSLKNNFIKFIQKENEISTSNGEVPEKETEAEELFNLFESSNEFYDYLGDKFGIDSNDFEKDLNKLKDYELINGKLVNKDEADEGEGEDEDLLIGVLNGLLDIEKFKEAIDENNNGEIESDELEAFYDAIKENDGDKTNISLEDIAQAIKDIISGEFSLNKDEEIEETKDDTAQAVPKNNNVANSGGSSGVGRSGGVGNNSGVSGNNGSSNNYNTASSNVNDNLSVEELEKQQKAKQDEVNTAKEEVNKVHSGENEAVKAAKDDCDAKEKAYNEAVKNDEKISDELKKKQEENQTNITKKEKEIDDLNIKINDCNSQISQTNSNISSGESQLSALESALSALNSQKTDDSKKQAEINSKKQSVQSQIKTVKEQINKNKEQLKKLQNDKANYEKNLNTAKEELAKLNEEKANIDKEIAENCSPETKKAQEEFNAAKEKVETTKTSELEKANQTLETKQGELDKITAQLNEAKAKEIEKENKVGDEGEDILELAKSFEGKTQAEMKEIMQAKGYTFCDGAWCADFVNFIASEAVGKENLADWYKNCSNLSYCPTIEATARANNAIRNNISEVQPGDALVFDWNNNATADHIGYVLKVEGNTIWTIEGNTSGSNSGSQVAIKQRDISYVNAFMKITA